MRDIARETRTNILAIEAEARAQERERLLERARQESTRVRPSTDEARGCLRWERLIGLFADPDLD
jgi:hypothetical protein